MDIRMLPPSLIIILVLTLSFELFAQNSITSHVIASGGGNMNNENHAVSGTIGQPFAGASSNDNNFIIHGFLHNSLLVTDLKEDYKSQLKEFRLYQNYPNPFNPITTIEYSVPFAGYVTMKVFNVLGEEIKTLINNYKEPGNYSVPFHANNLPSGIYFYKIQAGSFNEVKKMLLLK